MKKKLIFSFILTAVLAFAFVLGISAATYGEANIYYFDSSVEDLASKSTADAMFTSTRDANDIITSYSGSFPKTNDEGEAISWYKLGQATVGENIYVAVKSFVTLDPQYANRPSDGRYLFTKDCGVTKNNVVSINFPNDSGIKSFSNGSAYGLYAQTGDYKPENSELLFAYFPNTYTVTDRAVQATPCLEVYFDENCTFTTLADVAFYGCKSLRKVVLPTSITKINGGSGAFYNCKSLTDVNLEELTSLTEIGNNAFKECDSLVEVKLPNSVTTIGERIFENCNSLVKVNFGASLGNLTQSLVYFSTNLQYIYLPDTIASSVGSHALTSSDSKTGYVKSVIFFNGTYEEALALKKIVTANGTSNNQKINHENFVEWDKTKSDSYYVELATTENKNYLVYGYNTCEEFYKGQHEYEEPTYGFSGEQYLSSYCKTGVCKNCNDKIVEKLCGALFINKGYSRELNGTYFDYGFTVDREEIAKYEALTGNTVSYGIIAAKKEVSENGKLIDDSLKAIEGTISMSFDGTAYNVYNVKVTGITEEEYKDKALYCCAYVIDGDKVSYIGNTVTEQAVLISYINVQAPNDEQ